ncbi:flavin monoamine oxidase family protein [Algiphilus sp.]|uniref:flavin monoamine oxidase family protein n=1 Tax=Algiphilus sp. TaxID=1872431 RepID=UPI003B51861E
MKESALDAVVVGAGFAGLAAARRLREAGKRVQVVDARERVGGRVMRGSLAGQTIDLGGQWVGVGHDRLTALAKEAGRALKPQYVEGDKLLAIGGRQKRYRGLIPPVSPGAIAGMGWVLWRLRRLQQRVPGDAPWQAAQAEALDACTLAQWRDRNLPTADGRALFDIATRAVLCVEADQISMLAFLHYLAANGDFETLTSTVQGAQAATVEGGMHALASHLAEPLGADLRLNAPVTAIAQDSDGVAVHSTDGTLRARRAIVAMAPALAGRIAMAPVSAAREQLAQRMPMGSVIKCQVAYAQPFWRAQGLSGELVSQSAVFSPVFDNSPADGSVGLLVGFIDGAEAVQWSGRPEARKRAVIDSLVAHFGAQAAQPIDYVDQDWIADPWSRGCYTGVPTPGTLSRLGPALREPCDAIHWAGTETAEAWCGYIEGALLSGERAAGEVLEALA